MPKQSKKNTVRRYRRRRRPGFLISSGPGLTKSFPMGKTYRWRTRYCDTNFRLTPTVSQFPVSHVFSMNGLWDPDFTGIGHQPIGFDQLVGTIYDHYTVIGSRAKVHFTNLSTISPQNVLLQLKDTTTTSGDMSAIIENGTCVTGVLGPRNTGECCKTLSINCSMKKFFSRNVMNDSKYEGNAGNNPLEGVYLHVTTQPMVGGDLEPVSFNIEIEYIVILHEPRQLASS